MEIEKKFFVKKVPDLGNCQFYSINQGYISFTPEVRIRKKEETYFLTFKGDGTQNRDEEEIPIDKKVYDVLLGAIQGKLIEKNRYDIPLYDGLIAELDIYHGDLEGLIIVETEFKTEEQADSFIVPDWFGEEITENKRYKNKNLARLENVQDLIPQDGSKKLKRGKV